MNTLLEQVTTAGLKLSAHGDQIRIQGPQRILDHSPLMEEIRKHKTEILVHLKGDLYQKWLFEIVKVGEDPWMVGTRLDKPECFMFWFVKDAGEVSRQ